MVPARRFRLGMVCLVVAAVCAVAIAPGRAQTPTRSAGPAIAEVSSALRLDGSERLAIGAFYAVRPETPTWTRSDGELTEAATSVVTRFHTAAAHGLEVRDYLEIVGDAVTTTTRPAPADRWSRDVRMTVAALRLLRHLERGRLDAAFNAARLAPEDDPAARARALAWAVAEGRVAEVFDAAAPQWPAYASLVAALQRYRTLSEDRWPPLPLGNGVTRPGEPLLAAEAIRRRLEAFGDFAAPRPRDAGPLLDSATVLGVQAFQRRHGLTSDGVIGPRTRAALVTPVSTRVRQIALALERLRGLPRPTGRRAIVINLPMFRLWAFEAGQVWGTPTLSMPVIVGRARATPSPLLIAALEHLTFRPYWNVPASIARHEILPAVQRDPGVLARQSLEIVDGPGDATRVIAPSASALASVRAGRWRIRQRPGPGNALGLVAFAFPNSAGVSLHDTPTRALFSRDRRDFSHGCIRVAEASVLAAWALAGVPAWSTDRIAEAMASGPPTRVEVGAATDVSLVYLTAVVDPVDGLLHFADDVYGLDARLARALQTQR